MRRITAGVMAGLLASFVGPAALAADDLCEPLRQFADSVTRGETRAIRFHTIWGSNFKDRGQPANGAKRCDFEGYEPGRTLCQYLMENGSLQFPGESVKQAMHCLSRKNRLDMNIRVYAISVGVPYEMKGGIGRIDIDLHKNEELGGVTLTITANGL